MIIRLGTTSLAGMMLIVLVAISPCAVGNVTTEPSEYREINRDPNISPNDNGDQESTIANYGILLEPPSDGDQSFDSVAQNDWSDGAPIERASIKKRHLAALARDGDMAARRLHRNPWWNSGVLKRTLASLAWQDDSTARRIPHYGKRYQDVEQESSYDEDDDQVTEPVSVQDKRNLASMARLGDDAARRINYQTRSWEDPLADWKENAGTGSEDENLHAKRNLASLARHGDAAARRLNAHTKRLWDEEGEYDDQSIEAMDQKTADVPEYEKRTLASLARQGDAAARRLSAHTKRLWDEEGEHDDQSIEAMDQRTGEASEYEKRTLASLARHGDAAARRLSAHTKRLWDEEGEYDDQSIGAMDQQTGNSLEYEKRTLAAMARHGDAAARKLYLSRGGMVSPPTKRHLGALAREGALKNMWQFGKGVPRPWNYGIQESWYRQPKRHDNGDGDDDDNDDDDEPETAYEEEAEAPLTIVKKHIAALARRGSLINLRWQRRPLPPNWYKNGNDYDSIRSNGGYKRNIQSLARTAPAGSGYRSWTRGRFWSPSTEPSYQRMSRLRSGSQDRARGVRSTREGYLDTLPRSPAALAYRPAYGNYDTFRAPMAFVSRHMFKRASDATYAAIYPRPEAVIPQELLLHLEDPFPQSAIESEHAGNDAPEGASGAPQRLGSGTPTGQKKGSGTPKGQKKGSGAPKGQKAGLGEHAPSPEDKH